MSEHSPPASSENVRRTMLANRRRDTKPELEVRKRLLAAGLRYRVDFPVDLTDRRRRADIVFTRARLVVRSEEHTLNSSHSHASRMPSSA